jgi:hypothetical protein
LSEEGSLAHVGRRRRVERTTVEMDLEKGQGTTTTRQPNAWSVCGASAAAVSAVAAIAAAAIAGGLVDYRDPATPGETVISEITASLEASVTDLKDSIQRSSEANPVGPKLYPKGPFLAKAYNDVHSGSTDAYYTSWEARIKPIGSHSARLAESGDASDGSGNPEYQYIGDGKDGKTDWGFGPLAPILTIGEHDVSSGYVPVGVPDGVGIMKTEQDTVRMIYQSESYGNLEAGRSWFQEVNYNGAKFTGSHVTYVDYHVPTTPAAYTTSEPTKLSYDFADKLDASNGLINAAPTVKGAGSVFDEVYNLKGDKVVARNGTTAVATGAHFGDTSADGNFVTSDVTDANAVSENAWTFHSFCSAHLEQARQWATSTAGQSFGVEDDMWVTNEEWTDLDGAKVTAHGFAGLSAHIIDIAAKKMYATGAFGLGGFEKIVEFNCGHEDFVCFSPSGYNGNFGGSAAKTAIVTRKTTAYGSANRPDGQPWVYPQNIVPSRIYVGRKGYKADGTACGADCTFLERNGLEYGQVYGYAVDASVANRDAWHLGNTRTASPSTHTVSGKWAKISWQFDSSAITDIEDTDVFHWQDAPVLPNSVTGTYKFWTAAGPDNGGAKTEHNSPSPIGEQKFVQGSTAGYFGIYEVLDMPSVLDGLSGNALPTHFDGSYEMIEGETDVNTRIHLCSSGSCTQGKLAAAGKDATQMYDGSWKTTFEDIDGLEWIVAKNDGSSKTANLHGVSYPYEDYFVIQEDSGNKYGDRLLIAEMPAANTAAKYNFVAMAGGALNSRMKSGVSIPAGTFNSATGSEFSGVADASGALRQTTMGGAARRIEEIQVEINDKSILIGLQQHSISKGVVEAFGADRGGQIYMWDVANV